VLQWVRKFPFAKPQVAIVRKRIVPFKPKRQSGMIFARRGACVGFAPHVAGVGWLAMGVRVTSDRSAYTIAGSGLTWVRQRLTFVGADPEGV